ncbi:hypothetical protein DWV00_30215 [Trinickia dinghuensis]|uniref:DUF2846 domain-containing protein n=1 Tax=Trinickia dinghuensis TaxID=2291023 RepID=A0A3D8JS74_9BURK|nr:hypothetical protein DWV00_30215 [Trinickia dinghuensis]
MLLAPALLLGACATPANSDYTGDFAGHFTVVQTSNSRAPLASVDLKFEANGYGYIAMQKPSDHSYTSVHLYYCRSLDVKRDSAQVQDYPSHQVRCSGDDGRVYFLTLGPAGMKLGQFSTASGYALSIGIGYGVFTRYSLDRPL